jgi:hypothetical protein
VKGYKAFNKNLTCKGYQFTIGEIYKLKGNPILCKQGFHYCTDLQDIVKYYHFPSMRVFEIEAGGIITEAKDDCSKRACSEIILIKELSLEEVMLSITKSETAFKWAWYIGNREIMINKVTESKWAYAWASWIGDVQLMKPRVIVLQWVDEWNKRFKNES